MKKERIALVLFAGLGLFTLVSVTGCVTLPPPPVEDYVLARAAIDAAKAIDAGRYSPGYFHKSEVAFQQAQAFYTEREYDQADEGFIKAREYAEKSENSARLIRFKNGDVL